MKHTQQKGFLMMIKKIIGALFVVGLIIVGVILVNNKKDAIQNSPKPYIYNFKPIETNTSQNSFESFTAHLKAKQRPIITTKVNERVQKIYVKENQKIKKGDIILELETHEHKAKIKQIEYSIKALILTIDSLQSTLSGLLSDAKYAKKLYETNKKLFKNNSISEQVLELSRIAYELKEGLYNSTRKQIKAKQNEQKSQEENLKALQSLEGFYTIKSPIDGIVVSKDIFIGDMSTLGKVLFQIESFDQELSFQFSSLNIKKNQEIYYQNKKIGYIEYISSTATNYLKTANIKLDAPLEIPTNSIIDIKVKIQ